MNSSFVYDDYTTDAIYYETDSVTGKKLGFLEDDDNITLTVTGIKYPDKSGATILKLPTKFRYYKNGVLDHSQVYDVSGYDPCAFHPYNIHTGANEQPDTKLQNVSIFGYYSNSGYEGNGVTGIETINLPEDSGSLEYLADRVFAGLPNLKSMDLSNAVNLKFIGQYAFTRNYELSSFKFPSTIVSNKSTNPNNYQRKYRYFPDYKTATEADYEKYHNQGGEQVFSTKSNTVNPLSGRIPMKACLAYTSIKTFDFRAYPNFTYIPADFMINNTKLETLVISKNILGNLKDTAFGFRNDKNKPGELPSDQPGELRAIYYEGSADSFKNLGFSGRTFVEDSTIEGRFKKFGAVYSKTSSSFVYDSSLADPYIYCLEKKNNGSRGYERVEFFSIKTQNNNGVEVPDNVTVLSSSKQTIDNNFDSLPSNFETVAPSSTIKSRLSNIYDTTLSYNFSITKSPTLGTATVNNDGTFTYKAFANKGHDSFTVSSLAGKNKVSLKVEVDII